MSNCRKTYCDYGSYLRSRGFDSQLCKDNLTNGGVINGNLIINGNETVNGIETINGELILNGSETITGDSFIGGNVIIRGNLIVDGSSQELVDFIGEDLLLAPLAGNPKDTIVIYQGSSKDVMNVFNDVSNGSPELVFAIDGSDNGVLGHVRMLRGVTISGGEIIINGEISGNFTLPGYVTEVSFNELVGTVVDLSTNFYNIYDPVTGTLDVSDGVFYGDVSINGTLQVGTTSTYITTDSIRIANKLDISDNMELSGNIRVINDNSIQTRYINNIDGNGININTYSTPSDITLEVNNQNITLFNSGSIDIDASDSLFLSANNGTIQMDASQSFITGSDQVLLESSKVDVSGTLNVNVVNDKDNNGILMYSTSGLYLDNPKSNISLTDTSGILLESEDKITLSISNEEYLILDGSGVRLKKDLISTSNGLHLVKDNSNNQQSRLYGEIITILDIEDFSFNSTDFSLNTVLDKSTFTNGIIYSNSSISGDAYDNSGGALCIDLSNNRNYFIESFFEIYLNVDVTTTNNNVNISSFFNFEGINNPANRFTIDTRSFSIKTPNTITAVYGPRNFLTGTDGILSDKYRLTFYGENNALTTFSNLRVTLKQKIL